MPFILKEKDGEFRKRETQQPETCQCPDKKRNFQGEWRIAVRRDNKSIYRGMHLPQGWLPRKGVVTGRKAGGEKIDLIQGRWCVLFTGLGRPSLVRKGFQRGPGNRGM